MRSSTPPDHDGRMHSSAAPGIQTRDQQPIRDRDVSCHRRSALQLRRPCTLRRTGCAKQACRYTPPPLQAATALQGQANLDEASGNTSERRCGPDAAAAATRAKTTRPCVHSALAWHDVVRRLVHTMKSTAHVRQAHSPSAVALRDANPTVCATERQRALQYISDRGYAGEATQFVPFENRRVDRNRDAIMHRLRSLLRSRGTLCSTPFPCTVAPAPGGRNHTLQVCLPRLPEGGGTFCQASPMQPPSKGWFLIKACARGARRRCFTFDTRAIMRYYGELRRIVTGIRQEQRVRREQDGRGTSHEPKSLAPKLLASRLGRCALVMSGHTLRCGRRKWARLIENRSHYAAVFRANNYGRAVDVAGSRTDVAYHNCEAAPRGASCVEDQWLESSTIMPTRRQLLPSTGLGATISGGSLSDLAIASCKRVDVFGAGMFSRGPGNDVVYQHYYDNPLTTHCRAPCLSAVLNRVEGQVSREEANISRRVCLPKSECSAINRTHAPSATGVVEMMASTLFASEVPDDFYFRSELRLHVLHALGELNWVWY